MKLAGPTKLLWHGAKDITERVELEEQLKRPASVAIGIGTSQIRGSGHMSHEIRTANETAVIGMTGLLLDTDMKQTRDCARQFAPVRCALDHH